MINFKSYPSMTKCIIPNSVTLTNNNFFGRFHSMNNLVSVEIPSSITNMNNTFYIIISPFFSIVNQKNARFKILVPRNEWRNFPEILT